MLIKFVMPLRYEGQETLDAAGSPCHQISGEVPRPSQVKYDGISPPALIDVINLLSNRYNNKQGKLAFKEIRALQNKF